MSSEMVGPTSTKWRPPFEPRTYPALMIIIVCFYACALAAFAEGIAGAVLLWSVPDLPLRLFLMLSTLLVHLVVCVLCAAAAETIRIWIDVQANTQEAAFYAKMGYLGRPGGP